MPVEPCEPGGGPPSGVFSVLSMEKLPAESSKPEALTFATSQAVVRQLAWSYGGEAKPITPCTG